MTTLLEIRTKVKDDLDLDEETFINDSDLNSWINEATRKAERQYHALYEDYFLNETITAITTASNLVPYPSDIYANKIRKIVFSSGTGNNSNTHEVKRVKDLLDAKSSDFYDDSSNPILRWSPINDAATGRMIRLFPDDSRNGNVHIFYIRNARKLVNDSDISDIDEFEDYIVQYTKTQAYLKDGDLRADDSKTLESEMLQDMVETLSDMAPDKDNLLEADTSHYEESVGGGY